MGGVRHGSSTGGSNRSGLPFTSTVTVAVMLVLSLAVVMLSPSAAAASTRPLLVPSVTVHPVKTAGEIPLSWTYPGDVSLTSQRLEIRSAAPGLLRDNETVVLSSSTRSTLLSGLSPDRGYRFRVYGVNQFGKGVRGPWVQAVARSVFPAVPDRVSASIKAQAPTSAVVSWSYPASAPAVTSFRVLVDGPDGSLRDGEQVWVSPLARSFTVSGLSRDVAYSFQVQAVNQFGRSDLSLQHAAGPPAVPTDLVAGFGGGWLTVSWAYPGSDVAPPVTSFRVRFSADGAEDQVVTVWNTRDALRSFSVPVESLPASTTVSVRAVNGLTVSPWSLPSSVLFLAPPDAPTGVSASLVAPGELSVSFTPGFDGGSEVLAFTAECVSSDGGVTGAMSGLMSPIVVSQLTPGASYVCSVTGENALGVSAAGVGPAVVAGAAEVPPSQPESVSASAGDGEVVLSWLPPVSDGGAAVSDYTVQYREVASPSWLTWLDEVSSSTGATVTGLVNGVEYEFQVSATNVAGSGAFSAAVATTPTAPLSAPLALQATPGYQSVTFDWSAPSSGGPVTDYQLQQSPDGVSWSPIVREVSTETSFTLSGLSDGETVHFRVAASSASETGPFSAAVSAAAFAPLASGGSVTFANGRWVHMFTSGGTFTALQSIAVQGLAVAGGYDGVAGSASGGGAGGAGGQVTSGSTTFAAGARTITVGAVGGGLSSISGWISASGAGSAGGAATTSAFGERGNDGSPGVASSITGSNVKYGSGGGGGASGSAGLPKRDGGEGGGFLEAGTAAGNGGSVALGGVGSQGSPAITYGSGGGGGARVGSVYGLGGVAKPGVVIISYPAS